MDVPKGHYKQGLTGYLREREVNESWGVWESVQSLFLADTDELTD